MKLPNSIPLLLGRGFDDVLAMILSEPDAHINNIVRLSKMCKVKIKFNTPVTIFIDRRRRKSNITEHVFHGFFLHGESLCYKFMSNGRSGQYLPINTIESYEPVLSSVDSFLDLEEFRKMFDTYFITEQLIKELWEGTSAQHGGKYKPSDFKPISASGKQALMIFLNRFKGVDSSDRDKYHEWLPADGAPTYYTIEGCCYGPGVSNNSRDIRISHQLNSNRVSYSSEHHGCGNGRYGILATKSAYLWLKDD